MEKSFNNEFYKKLYDKVCEIAEEMLYMYGNDDEEWEDGFRWFTPDIEAEIDNVTVYLEARFEEHLINDYYNELGKMDDFKIDVIYDEDDNDITDRFSDKEFRKLIKQTA